MEKYQEEIFEKSENYKLMKKLIMATNEEEIAEIGIFFNMTEENPEI